MTVRRLTQLTIKSALFLTAALRPNANPGCNFLAYHSVSGQVPTEMDLAPVIFERQLTFLADTARVIGYDPAFSQLQSDQIGNKPGLVLTFDDAYLNFYTHVFPLLQRLNLPAILFVPTGFIEERIAYPMPDNFGLTIEPVTWEMLGEMAASGLVTLGAHTHTHPVLTKVSLAQLEEELARPLELFQKRLGLTPRHFAYPRAIWNIEVEKVVMRYYQSAVVAGGKRATIGSFHPYRIPRLTIRRSDSWSYFLLKVHSRISN
ncbi:MAG: polysaccharide deacetylase family protein [Caldilinea sp. CFX5]|nr:polysaccharide deacetylase family protein [Caldilinea sp. CFX5]